MLGTNTLSKAELCLSIRKQPVGTKCCCLPCQSAYEVRRVRSVCVCISVQHLSISWTMPRSAASTGSNRACSSPILASAAVMDVQCVDETADICFQVVLEPGVWDRDTRMAVSHDDRLPSLQMLTSSLCPLPKPGREQTGP